MAKNSDRQRMHPSRNSGETNLDFAKMMDKLSEGEKTFVFSLLEKDPLGGLYKKSLAVYLLIACLFLLWPFHFVFPTRNGVYWLPNSNGIEFKGKGQVLSAGPAVKLCRKLRSGTGLSLEVWAATNRINQTGPARIVSYSLDASRRNFTLGQSKDRLVMRLRTTQTDRNGVWPHMALDHVFDTKKLQHIVVTYDFSEQRIYIDGKIRGQRKIPGGDFSYWDPSCYLVFGNEATGNRPWSGKLLGVAIYNRALSAAEVQQNFQAGWSCKLIQGAKHVDAGLVARYLFDEGEGTAVEDSPRSAIALNLSIPKWIQTPKRSFMVLSCSQFANGRDVLLNILAFIPIGFFFYGALRGQRRSSLIVLASGALFTLAIESIQYFIPARTSSFADVIDNCVGIAVGIVLFKIYGRLLRTRYQHYL